MEDIEAERESHLRKVTQSVDSSEKELMETTLKLEKTRLVLEKREEQRKKIQQSFKKKEKERIFKKILEEAVQNIEIMKNE